MGKDGWIGVDLDGTLAVDEYSHIGEIGRPVPAMLERVRGWLREGVEVRIFTARVGPQRNEDMAEAQRELIEDWCIEHIGRKLLVTATKDYMMRELWDDRAVQVVKDTGERVGNVSR